MNSLTNPLFKLPLKRNYLHKVRRTEKNVMRKECHKIKHNFYLFDIQVSHLPSKMTLKQPPTKRARIFRGFGVSKGKKCWERTQKNNISRHLHLLGYFIDTFIVVTTPFVHLKPCLLGYTRRFKCDKEALNIKISQTTFKAWALFPPHPRSTFWEKNIPSKSEKNYLKATKVTELRFSDK